MIWPIINPIFIVCSLAYIVLFIVKKQGVILPVYIRSYAADLLCLPIVLSMSLVLMRKLRKSVDLTLSIVHVATAFIYLSLVFEYFLPRFSPNYTSDVFDVAAYGLGGIIYYLIQEVYYK